MKYFPKLGYHKNSTGTNKVDLENVEAFSYDWWKYLTKINGLVIFNHTNYSMSTCKHQSDCLKLLRYDYDIKFRYTTKSLSNIKEAVIDEVHNRLLRVRELERLIDNPRTRKSTNVKRAIEITEHTNFITMLKMTQLGE